jgi:hypothetical protein
MSDTSSRSGKPWTPAELVPWHIDGRALLPGDAGGVGEDAKHGRGTKGNRGRRKRRKGAPKPVAPGVPISHPPQGQNLISFPRGGRKFKSKTTMRDPGFCEEIGPSYEFNESSIGYEQSLYNDLSGNSATTRVYENIVPEREVAPNLSMMEYATAAINPSRAHSQYSKVHTEVSGASRILVDGYFKSANVSGTSRIVVDDSFSKRNNSRISASVEAQAVPPKPTRNDELFYSWLGHRWETNAPVEKWKSIRLETPSDYAESHRSNPFRDCSPRTNRRIEIDSMEQKLRRALGIKYDPASTEVDDAILAVRERAEISSHCFAHLASKISVRSKEEANLLTMSWQVQMDSLNRIYKLMKHLDKRVKGVDNRVASIQRSFNATIKNLTDRATEREEKCFHHIKKLEAHLVATERDILTLRLDSSQAKQNSRIKPAGKSMEDDSEDSDEDALSSRVYQKLAQEYDALNSVNGTLRNEMKALETERDHVVSMLSKVIGNGLSTADLIESLENRVESIDAKDISSHIHKKTEMLETIMDLRDQAKEELRFRTYRANQRALIQPAHETNKKTDENYVAPTLLNFWNVELSAQKLEIGRLKRRCKSSVQQKHPLIQQVNDIFGTRKDRKKSRKKKKNKAVHIRNKDWLLQEIHCIYTCRLRYTSNRTCNNILSSTVKDFPSFTFSYFLDKYKDENRIRTSIKEFLDAVEVYGGTAGEGNAENDRWIAIFSEFINGKIPTSTVDFFLFLVSLVSDCCVGIKYPRMESYNVPYWISAIAATKMLDRVFPRTEITSKELIKNQIKALQSRATVQEVTVAITGTNDKPAPDYRLPYLAFLDLMLQAFQRESQKTLDEVYQNFSLEDKNFSGYVSYESFKTIVQKFNRVTTLHKNLETLFLEESNIIRELIPLEEQFNSACKIDFFGVCNVLERTGAYTLHLGYMLEPPLQPPSAARGNEVFAAINDINRKSTSIYASLLKQMHSEQSKESITMLMFCQQCVDVEERTKISPFRIEFAMQKFLNILHEQLLLQEGSSGEVPLGYFQQGCEAHLEIITRRRGLGEEYLQHVLKRQGETTAEKVARNTKVLLVIRRQLLKKLQKIRERKLKSTAQ